MQKARYQAECLDSIINKTPLSYRTNRIIGGVAPSEYLAKLEKGNETTPSIDRKRLNIYLTSHLINPALLRADSFDAFMVILTMRSGPPAMLKFGSPLFV